MKSITIHGLNDTLDRLIRKRAKEYGTSLNRTIKKLLEDSLGIHPKHNSDHRDEFMDLFGSWSKDEEKVFNKSIDDLGKIDDGDWQ